MNNKSFNSYTSVGKIFSLFTGYQKSFNSYVTTAKSYNLFVSGFVLGKAIMALIRIKHGIRSTLKLLTKGFVNINLHKVKVIVNDSLIHFSIKPTQKIKLKINVSSRLWDYQRLKSTVHIKIPFHALLSTLISPTITIKVFPVKIHSVFIMEKPYYLHDFDASYLSTLGSGNLTSMDYYITG